MTKSRFIRVLTNERGIASLLVTLLVMPILLFLCFAIVPFFVYAMRLDHMHMIANHALKEAEVVGHVSPSVITNTNARLNALGLGAVTVGGTSYPSYTGSTSTKVLRDAADPTITLTLKYPAPNLTKMLAAIRGSGSSSTNEGYYVITLYGRSEAYN
ncbi:MULTISPECIES: hypothetical protein [unclassified Paenibacillus]|uniref:hypothetical protein n=1 Tax=unclassified Paenibacillus TaxID=185978 RepID=UPI0027821D1F|nr:MULTISPECIES: hypothetical protein [unclassified Paenibacillus]MDQ0896206.1 hypothetical protein [Paenibacillus sp. V4I7]MDQ0913978.1 hypothetical protein [Paenibacillus sp. V4I5]